MKPNPDDVDTARPCPLCCICKRCGGTGKYVCAECPEGSHERPCTVCRFCGLCEGTKLVSPDVLSRWLSRALHSRM